MASKTLDVKLKVTDDGATATFKKVGDSSRQMGESLERAGLDGVAGMQNVVEGAQDATRALDDTSDATRSFGDRMQGAANTLDDFGEVLTVIGAGLLYAGTQAMENERQIIALQQAYGDAADQMIQFSEDLSDSLSGIFTDEDVRRGALYFATLREQYGLSIDQIEELMTRTADLAALRGISFEDASSRITSAIRGETEAAEYLNLTLNQQSIDREGITLSMTNQEAAQFRLNAALEQSAIYQGTAQQIAESSIGTYASMTDRLQDMSVVVGDFVGPWGSMVTGFGTAAIGISGTVGAFGKLTSSIRTSTIAVTALNTVVRASPWVAAFTAGATAAYALNESFEEGETVTSRLDAAFDALASGDITGFFTTLAVGADEATTQLTSMNDAIIGLLEQSRYQAAIGNEEASTWIAQLGREQETLQDWSEAYLNSVDLRYDAVQATYNNGLAVSENEARIREEMTLTDQEMRAHQETLDALATAYLDPAINSEELAGKQRDLYFQVQDGKLTMDEYSLALRDLAVSYGLLPPSIDSTSASITDSADALLSVFGIVREQAPAVSDQIGQIIENNEEAAGSFLTLAEAMGGVATDASADYIAAMQEIVGLGDVTGGGSANLFGELPERAADFQERLEEVGEAGTDALIDIAEEARQAREEFIASGMALAGWDNALSQINFTSLASDSSVLAENLIRAGMALDNVFRVLVGNTDAIASQVQGVEDWALELIGVQGEWAKIDDLLANGAITLEQYNAAQQAQIQISQANAAVQEDILAIQAQQAPFIAEMTAAQAAYVDELSRAPEHQQRLALAWMDTNTAAQAHEGILLANSVAMGEWGANGEVAFEGFIRGAVQANPLLFDLWESVGLISGTPMDFTVNTEGLEGAQSELGMLIDSLDHLTMVLAEIFGIEIEVEGQEEVDAVISLIEDITGRRHAIGVDAETDDASFKIQGVVDYLTELDGSTGTVTAIGIDDASDEILHVGGLRSALDGMIATVTAHGIDNASDEINSVDNALSALSGDTATVYINAIDNAGGVLGSVAAQLASLDGRSATSYVDTVYRTVGATPFAHGGVVGLPAFAHGGALPAFAGGGMVPFWAGENGPEIAHFATGGTALIPTEGLYAAPPMTYISPNNAVSNSYGGINITIPIYGNVYGISDLTEQVATELAPVLRDLASDIRASQVNY